MYLRDWKLFLTKGDGNEIAVATAPERIVAHLDAASPHVYFHHDYMLKAMARHAIKIEWFQYIFDVVERGRSVADKPRHVTFFHLTSVGWFQVTIKVAVTSRRLYLCTFYKINKSEIDRRLRKFTEIY